MTITPNSVDDADLLISRTCQQLTSQRTVPLSPGRADGSKLLLCAGALLVREASAMILSKEFANRFEREVVTRNSDYIRQVAATIGLDEPSVNSLIIRNDRLSPAKRLSGTMEHISSLRSLFRQ